MNAPNQTNRRQQGVFGADVDGCQPRLSWSEPYGALYALGCAREDVLHRIPDVPEVDVDQALVEAARAHEADSRGQFRLIARDLVRQCWGQGADRRMVDALEIELRVYAAIAVALATP